MLFRTVEQLLFLITVNKIEEKRTTCTLFFFYLTIYSQHFICSSLSSAYKNRRVGRRFLALRLEGRGGRENARVRTRRRTCVRQYKRSCLKSALKKKTGFCLFSTLFLLLYYLFALLLSRCYRFLFLNRTKRQGEKINDF